MNKSKTELDGNYDDLFFEATDRHAQCSAKVVLPLLQRHFPINSVVDFGCGNGEWLRMWKELAVDNVVGIDGELIKSERLLIDPSEFIAHDLRQPIDLGRKFDLVQSLEVAEHLPDSCAEAFIDMLVAHGERVLFSAATPGQMGVQHINEQPYHYWREKFERHGFVLVDWLRPRLKREPTVAFWYRYNMLLFFSGTKFERLSEDVKTFLIPSDCPVPDVSPLAYRVWQSVTRRLPVSTVGQIVRLACRWEQRKLRRQTAPATRQ